jgi:glycosyltransferase involved in cell wall biosynthesis
VHAFADRVAREWSLRGRERHHLQGTSLPVVASSGPAVRAADLPDADVVIGTWWETMEWIARWPLAKGRPAYYVQHHELHGGDAERVQTTYRQPALKIVVASWLQRLLTEEYAEPDSVLVPNGIDLAQFETPRRARQPQPTVGMMMSRKAWKRTDLALEAVRCARAALPELRLVAFGSDPLSTAQSASAPPSFEFHLRPQQAELREIYQACDVWLLPSDLEGFGLPGLEAAACRCPVIATRCGGPEDYVEEGISGYLVPVGDPVAMADRLVALLRAPEPAWCAMSDASYAISRRFRWDRSAEILERALQAYVSRPQPEDAQAAQEPKTA